MRARLSEAYASCSREQIEEKWIVENLPLVRHIVNKVGTQASSREDVEDLISAGTLGLVKAARAYDPSRDAEFRTYAYIRVRGAVIDELRSRSFAPSGAWAQIRRVQQVYKQMTDRAGSPPADEEVAAELGVPLAQLYRTLEEARRQNFLSIHGLGDESTAAEGYLPADAAPGPDAAAERQEMIERLTAAISQLAPRDRQIVLLYYERDLTMKEAAAVLGVTESRISQLHAAALFKLAMKLKRSDD
jgi:RNA polymerase sigma factor for flagellar operon FliA